jgi:outer membrane biosynthesis protein TonB
VVPTSAPAKNPLPLIAVGGGVLLLVLIAGAFALKDRFLKPGAEPTPEPITDATPIPQPTPPPPPTPKPMPTPAPTPAPVTMPEVTATEAGKFANRAISSRVALTGSYRVSTAFDRVATLRPAAAELRNSVRVTATYPAGTRLPAEGATVNWKGADGWIIREVRKGNDGQLNISVEQTR